MIPEGKSTVMGCITSGLSEEQIRLVHLLEVKWVTDLISSHWKLVQTAVVRPEQ